MKTTTITIQGVTPLLMHNGRLADPLDPAAKAIAAISKKRSKTDEDHYALRKAEWYGSLYTDSDGEPCIPGECIEACLVDGAKRYKLGKASKGGIIIDDDVKIQYKGPKNIDKLWDDGGYIKVAGVKVQRNRVIRSRPMFPEWSLTFDVLWDEFAIEDEDRLFEIVESAGRCGLGDWRPKFGRFELVE